MKPGRWGALLLCMVPTVALAGRVFQWTDKQGQVHATDNLWELPPEVRTRYLELIEEEAREKYSPQQIRDLKEAGNWPPLELIRPKSLANTAQAKEWMGFKLLGTNLEARKAVAEEFRFQWDSLFADRKRLTEAIPRQEAAVAALTEEFLIARNNDGMLARTGETALAPAVAKRLEQAVRELDELRREQAALAAKERDLIMGVRAYLHPGEDGGPATFSN